MKTSILFVLFVGLCMFGWSQQTKSSAAPRSPEEVTSNTVTYKGTFRSLRGVMNTFSCHCFDGGILTTQSGKEIKVCFEQGELEEAQSKSENMRCSKLQVTGVMVDHFIDGEGACTSGTVTYLKVKSFKCLN